MRIARKPPSEPTTKPLAPNAAVEVSAKRNRSTRPYSARDRAVTASAGSRYCPNVRLASLWFLGSFGCATLVDGGRQEVRIDTEPDFAKAIVDGAVHPGDATVDLDRGRDHRVLLRKPGYEDRELAIRSGVSPWFWANFGFGPLFFVGMIVDAASGAMRRLDAKELRAELDPIATPSGEVARRGAAINDAIRHERIALGELAPLFGAERERWVVAVVEGASNVEPELLRAVTDQIRLFLAAREVRVV